MSIGERRTKRPMAAPIFIVLMFATICLFSSVLAKSNTYIIHMDSSAMPKPFSDHHNWYLATIDSISETSKPTSKHVYTYTSSVHGFSATLTDSELEAIKKNPGYISSSRDRPVKIHTTRTSHFLGLSTDSGAWPATNYGEDVIIGVIDTGIWPESESFSDEGMSPVPSRWKGTCESSSQFNSSLCNKKLIGAYFFNRGLFANNPEVANITINSTRDTDGHGTHTSSTAAGNFVKGASYFGYASGTSRGMAPRARIAMYKAIWRSGVFESDVLAAVDQAIHDGVDILSLSLTLADDDMFLEDDSIAIASFSAIEKGIFVAAAAGNDGPSFYTLVNGAPWLLTVGAGTVDRELHGILTLGDKTQFSFPTLYPGNFSLSQRTLVFLDGCESVQEMKKYKHDIIVCKDNLSFSSQYENAESANVAAAVFITDITRLNYYTPSPFPAAFIGVHDGQKVINYMTSSNDPKASLQFQKTIVGTKPAPKVASYSARGPFTKCKYVLKPDIIAPGSSILASWSPVSSVTKVRKHDLFSKFNLDSGTSMATPHVAGVAALVKKMHPDWSPAAIRSALMTSANPLDNTNSPIQDEADDKIPAATPLDIGAGHIDPNKALEPGLIYDAKTEDYIKFLCAMNLTKKQIQFITRSSHHNCLNKSLDLNYPSFIAYFTGDESKSNGKMVVQEFPRTVTNVGEGISNYTAKLTKMNGIKVSVEPQKLAFKKKNEKLRYKLIIEGPKLLEEDVVYGSLSWVHDGGKYVVRSPIVATNLVP